MSEPHGSISRLSQLDEAAIWRSVVEGTAGEIGEEFFSRLVSSLSAAIGTHGAWVTEWKRQERRLHSYSLILGGAFVDGFNYDIEGTPCERVVEQQDQLIHIENNILELYPDNDMVRQTGAVSFMGQALVDLDGAVMGHLAVLDNRPLAKEPRLEALFRVFAARAAAELRRMRAEARLRKREATLARITDGCMDAIVDLDRELLVTHANAAVEAVFEAPPQQVVGGYFSRYLEPESLEKIVGLARALDARQEGHRASWVAGGLEARTATGKSFAAEASLSRSEDEAGTPYYTLILRNVNDRLRAESTIELLKSEAEYLREALAAKKGVSKLLGESPAFQQLRAQIHEVAATGATVLITGETGTGKELVADAIHASSTRRNGRIVKVNCGAIPENLIESEFFGHEAGAFTGATRKREGRFSLADGGTLFLDEVGELPLALQAKLLRALQEGEFEPVGSSRTKKVDVRVVAATNRDLLSEVRQGRFREDLYYRLAVFPVRVPPLRERPEDIPLLTRAFAAEVARRMGKDVKELPDHALWRMQQYRWPGNVRELLNVIERAVITSHGGRLDLSRALPEGDLLQAPAASSAPRNDAVLTMDDLRKLESANIVRALEVCGGRVSGVDGAAALLGMKPSTLRSKIQALGIK